MPIYIDKMLSFINMCLAIISFGSGYIVSSGIISLNRGHVLFEKLFWLVLVIFTLAVCAYEITYKRNKSSIAFPRIAFYILLVYILPFAGGFSIGIFF